jgi:hypothetical protein
MDADITTGQARITPRDVASALGVDGYTAAASLAFLERQRDGQAAAELAWLLKQSGATPRPSASPVAAFRRAVGVALVRAGHRLAGAPGLGIPSATTPAASGPPGATG